MCITYNTAIKHGVRSHLTLNLVMFIFSVNKYTTCSGIKWKCLKAEGSMVGTKFAFLRGNLINSFVREYILKSCRRQTSSMCFVLERAT